MAGTLAWRKSSHSSSGGTSCVEVADGSVRDSKNPAGPVLVFPAERWREFLVEFKIR